MKIIDLLNKIANGEEVPKKIKYEENYYELKEKYNEYWEQFEYGYKTHTGGYLNIWRKDVLNDEVEIIEEDKKIPEKLPKWATTREDKEYTNQEEHTLVVSQKINEIIDYLKSKGEK